MATLKELQGDIAKGREHGLSDIQIFEKFKANHPDYSQAQKAGISDDFIIKRLGLTLTPQPTTPTSPFFQTPQYAQRGQPITPEQSDSIIRSRRESFKAYTTPPAPETAPTSIMPTASPLQDYLRRSVEPPEARGVGGTWDETPIEKVEEFNRDMASAIAYATGGVVKGFTLGYVDPSTGEVTIPFTSKTYKKFKGLDEVPYLAEANIYKPAAEIGGQIAGAIVPISKISKAVDWMFKGRKALPVLLRMGKGMEAKPLIRPALQNLLKAGMTGTIYEQVRKPPEEETIAQRAQRTVDMAGTFMALTGGAMAVNKAVESLGLGEIRAYKNLRKSIIDIFKKKYPEATTKQLNQATDVKIDELSSQKWGKEWWKTGKTFFARRLGRQVANRSAKLQGEIKVKTKVTPEPTPTAKPSTTDIILKAEKQLALMRQQGAPTSQIKPLEDALANLKGKPTPEVKPTPTEKGVERVISPEKVEEGIKPPVEEKAIPKELEALAKEARKHEDFYDFSLALGREIGFARRGATDEMKFMAERASRMFNFADRRLSAKDFEGNTEITVWRTGNKPIDFGDYVFATKTEAQASLEAGQGEQLFSKKVKTNDLARAGLPEGEYFYAPERLTIANGLKAFYIQATQKPAEKAPTKKKPVVIPEKTEVSEYVVRREGFEEYYVRDKRQPKKELHKGYFRLKSDALREMARLKEAIVKKEAPRKEAPEVISAKATPEEIKEYKQLKEGFTSYKFNLDSPQMKRLIELERLVEPTKPAVEKKEAPEVISGETIRKYTASQPKNEVVAKTLKIGDRFLHQSGEVYMVISTPKDAPANRVYIQDGKKRVLEAKDKVKIIGKVNDPLLIGKSGMKIHGEEWVEGFKDITPKEKIEAKKKLTKEQKEELDFIKQDLSRERTFARDWLIKVKRDLLAKSPHTRRLARKRVREARIHINDLTQRTLKQHAQVLMEQEMSPLATPKKNIITAIKHAETARAQQEEIRSRELGKKMAEAEKVKGVKGEKRARIILSKFKGKMERVEFKALKDKISQEDINALFDAIEETPLLSSWEKLPARTGLGKLFGEFGGGVPVESELKMLNRVFGPTFVKTLIDEAPLIKRMRNLGFEIANIPRAIMTSLDLSFSFRQALFMIPRHPVIFSRSFAQQFKWFFSEKMARAVEEQIKADKDFELAKESGLSIVERYGELAKMEEAYMAGRLFEGVNIKQEWNKAKRMAGGTLNVSTSFVRASNRAYSTFASKFRFDIFKSLMDNMRRLKMSPENELNIVRRLAQFINCGTGRGALGKLEKIAIELNTAIFSPRLASSRLHLLSLPYYILQPPHVRKEMLKTLFAFAGMIGTILVLAKWILEKTKKGSVETRWSQRTNADYMKIRIGNTRIDILGGFQQYIVLAMRIQSSQIISSTTGKVMTLGEGYRPLTRLDILYRTGEMKQSPLFSFATALLRGQTVIGEKVSVPKEVGLRFIPMVVQDVYDLAKDDPKLLPLSTLGIFGVGIQTYTSFSGEVFRALRTDKWEGVKKSLQSDEHFPEKSLNLILQQRSAPDALKKKVREIKEKQKKEPSETSLGYKIKNKEWEVLIEDVKNYKYTNYNAILQTCIANGLPHNHKLAILLRERIKATVPKKKKKSSGFGGFGKL